VPVLFAVSARANDKSSFILRWSELPTRLLLEKQPGECQPGRPPSPAARMIESKARSAMAPADFSRRFF